MSLVLRSIMQREPSDEEVQKMLKHMDTNNSGTIELEEFINAMSVWFANKKKKRQRDEDFEEERKEVHKTVKSFFSSFTEPSNLEEVQEELKKKLYRQEYDFDNIETNDSIVTTGSQIINVSNKAKVTKK